MKMSVGQTGTEFSSVTEEFNEMFGGNTPHPTWHWFLPLPVVFPRGMKKVVLGFDWDDTFDAAPFQEDIDDDDDVGGSHHQDEENGLQMIEPLSSLPSPLMASVAGSLPREASTSSVHSADGLNRRRLESREKSSSLEIV
jgi:hypothetical protein